MRWRDGGRSGNLEDRRGGGGGGRRAGGLGFVGVLLALAIAWFTGADPRDVLNVANSLPAGAEADAGADTGIVDPAEEPMVRFLSAVLDDAQQGWAQRVRGYRDAKLVLFRGAVRSGCGDASAAMGPFYCPADEKVYLDLGFFDELDRRYGAPGDFAQAYVLAHEVGHHVQRILGTAERVRVDQEADPSQANAASVALELQADCYAGVWAHAAAQRGDLEAGDLEEGLGAASAVGDDRLQREATGRVHPESFTHGTSEQRMEWFRRGFDSGDVLRCSMPRR
ncbi:MAG: zinc metallopeptidase [Gemmatimonadaceae bacterium]|nr:zinc metallopeptidase [Gemmatimonadaceae bacterium]